MKSILQKKILIISVLFFFFSAFMFFYLYKATLQNKSEAEAMKKIWQEEETKRENSKTVLNLLNSLAKERSMLDSHFILSSDAVPFLNSIENSAKSAGAKAELISIDIPKSDQLLAVKARTIGSFDSLYKFISLLENSKYNMKFDYLDIRKSEKDSWTLELGIKLLSFIN